MKNFEDLKWKEIDGKVKTFQLDEEPEVIYVIKLRDNEYMVVHEDAYDLHTGKVEFFDKNDLIKRFKIEI